MHIADVSYFMKPDTPLDEIASRRATTTYLIQRCYPMLPRILCENLCSLEENVDRLAFSVIWKMDAVRYCCCLPHVVFPPMSVWCKTGHIARLHTVQGSTRAT